VIFAEEGQSAHHNFEPYEPFFPPPSFSCLKRSAFSESIFIGTLMAPVSG